MVDGPFKHDTVIVVSVSVLGLCSVHNHSCMLRPLYVLMTIRAWLIENNSHYVFLLEIINKTLYKIETHNSYIYLRFHIMTKHSLLISEAFTQIFKIPFHNGHEP